jgi:hypothetical protein
MKVLLDENLPYQQNTDLLEISIFILDVRQNVLPRLVPFVPELLEIWEEPLEEKVYVLKEKK